MCGIAGELSFDGPADVALVDRMADALAPRGPDGRRSSTVYWDPPFARDPARADWAPEDWQAAMLEALRVAVDRRMVADVPVGVLLSGGLDSSLIVALLAQAGQRGLKTFSVGFPAAGGREGDEFAYSDLVVERFDTDHRQIRVDDARLLPALHEAVAAMSEPMVSHDCVAFHLLSEEVSQHVKVVQCGQGADEILAGYSWYQPLPQAPGDGFATYAQEFFDRPHDALVALLGDGGRLDEDASRHFAAEHFARHGADGPVDRALRLDSEVMLAAACPPALKLAHDGKGVLKDAARRVLPAEVIDRPKGYLGLLELWLQKQGV